MMVFATALRNTSSTSSSTNNQEVNPIQEAIVWCLHLRRRLTTTKRLTKWRGSDVDNILTFDKRYPGVEQISIEENFRSSEGIVLTTRRFIEQNTARLAKAMKPTGAQPYEAGDIVALSVASQAEQAQHIAATAQVIRGVALEEDGQERGLSWSDNRRAELVAATAA